MDTRYWGPDAWDLFHFITLHYPSKPTENDKKIHKIFFSCLPYILPCHYCRKSITGYLEELPIDPYLENKDKMIEWMWKLHNKVNDKLRKQKLITYSNPPLSIINKEYLPRFNDTNNMDCANMPGWKFFYSVIFTFKNEFKTLDFLRKIYIQIFFTSLSYVIPFPKIKLLFNHYLFNNPINGFCYKPNKLIEWLYNFEKLSSNHTVHICPKLDERELIGDKYKVKCGKKEDLIPTCRVKDIEDVEEH